MNPAPYSCTPWEQRPSFAFRATASQLDTRRKMRIDLQQVKMHVASERRTLPQRSRVMLVDFDRLHLLVIAMRTAADVEVSTQG